MTPHPPMPPPLTPPRPALHLDNISLHIQGHTILSHISLSLPSPGFVSILGPSGVGKTSLLNAIAGLSPLSDGAIHIQTPPSPPHNPVPITFMTQQHSLLPWFNNLDNVMIGFRLRGQLSPSLREKALSILDAVGLASHASSYPSTLSGGMQQRIMLARTLLEQPNLILMDEPFSSLDAITRHQVGLTARSLLHNRMTIMVTHDPLEALRLSDFLFLMTQNHGPLTPITLPPSPPPRSPTHPDTVSLHEQILQQLIPNTPHVH